MTSIPRVWNEVPFLRLLIPLVTGILLSYFFSIAVSFIIIGFTVSLFVLILLFFASTKALFRYRIFAGFMINLMLACFAMFITIKASVYNNKAWIGYHYQKNDLMVAVIKEPLAEKAKTYKAEADLMAICRNDSIINVKGRIIIYFYKKDQKPFLGYSSIISFRSGLQEIRGTGNPGAFNYQQFCAFKGITHQVFLKQEDYQISSYHTGNIVEQWIQDSKTFILSILKKYIHKDTERGIAEALLIGYRDHLDRDLVQAYSNTGVVHIIAISGLHLGMIYGLLLFVLKPLDKTKKIRWLKPLLIILSLWAFSFIAGASASVLRAAVMFSFICAGNYFNKNANIINSLAASAFCLLCYDPFMLWDVGFQLSYAAVLSIVLFMKPIENLIYIKNKLVAKLWSLCAITLSAQIFTTPLVMYHFHQFSNLFLLSNLIAVPLSSLILFGEILLCLIAPFTWLSVKLGKLITLLILWMNHFIQYIDHFSYAVTNNIQLSIPMFIFLFLAFLFMAAFLLNKTKSYLFASLISLIVFFTIRTYEIYMASCQQKIIIYHVPGKSAMDVIQGRQFLFIGDDELRKDGFLRNFNIKPSRIIHRAQAAHQLSGVEEKTPFIFANGCVILWLREAADKLVLPLGSTVDILILSDNCKPDLERLSSVLTIKQVVIDATNQHRLVEQWKTECSRLSLRCHYTGMDGAFILNCR
jgi:competence protein ComEC